ncbi:NAD(P)-binding protein [Xylona heveae TC161]|uniref:NAD(P)-binding protein n=1 Tax=Xylona heveae (strain CBS 132557 / TC161) TaxID=1328760 RepID=A0A165IT32_XYLHT|nr:NAD(P)-binding protein [Xylona heveae TC161]KZF25348.1 NAD(P)-binding protein [Xylona heveae TC161]
MSTAIQKVILLTGATGFIGFQTLLDALQAGFQVRCVVRSEAKGQALLSKPALQSYLLADNVPAPRVAIVVVPDQAAPQAFHQAIVGIKYVIHVASPLPPTQPGHLDAEADFLVPARRGTLEILEAAAIAPSVERVVITSSVVAFVSPKIFMGLERADPTHPFTPTSRVPLMSPPFPHAGIAYIASKVASLEATETWMRNHKPQFSVVNIHPSWVMGRAECLGKDQDGLFNTTNRLVLNTIVKGQASPFPKMMRAVVDVHDVARLQVESLQKADIVGSGECRSFIASIPGAYEEIPSIIQKRFPEEIRNGRITILGEQASFPLPIDSSDTEVTFGWKFRGLERIVTDLISQYIDLQ